MSVPVQWMDGVRVLTRELTELKAPAHVWERIEARLDGGDIVLLPAGPRRARLRPAAVAAGLLLCAGVAAALVPQTGLRVWLERQLGGDTDVVSVTPRPAPPETAQLAIPAVDGRVQVDITGAGAPLQLRVRSAAAADLGVSATGGAAAARFIAGSGRLAIAGAAGGEIVLDLPRSAVLVTVSVDGVRIIEARGAQLTVLAPRADTVGTELIVPVR